LEPVEVNKCILDAVEHWRTKVTQMSMPVRDIPDHVRNNFKYIKYNKWFASPDFCASKSPFFHLHRREQIKVIAQLRMGSHWLNSEKGRVAQDGSLIARSNRLCPSCSYNCREDEMHVLFECPFYNSIRLRFQSLFREEADTDLIVWNLQLSDADMRILTNGDGSRDFSNDMADFIIACKKKRQRHLEMMTILS
jgi:hypothetical protein